MKREKKRNSLNNEIDGSTLHFTFCLYPRSSPLRGIVTGSPTTKRKCNAFAILPFRYSKKNKKTFLFEQGASLLETVLYIGIFAVLTLLTIHTVLALTRAVGEIRTLRYTIRDSDIAMERIVREIRAAESVNTTASIFNTHPGKLVLTNISESITFSFSDGKIFLQKNSGPVVPFTGDSTAITNLTFTHLTTTNSEAIRIAMTLNNNQFYGTAILRKNYK